MRKFLTRRPSRRMFLPLVAVVSLALPMPTSSAGVAGLATWNSPQGGSSRCERPSPSPTSVLIRCTHNYSSVSVIGGRPVETCVAGGFSIPIDEIALDTCHAELVEVKTAGTGVNINDDSAVCETFTLGSPMFTIDTPFGFYEMEVQVENNEVISTFTGAKVLADGLLVAKVSGQFTGGCGLPAGAKGAFTGRFTITAI